jgi:hypothetical protein
MTKTPRRPALKTGFENQNFAIFEEFLDNFERSDNDRI